MVVHTLTCRCNSAAACLDCSTYAYISHALGEGRCACCVGLGDLGRQAVWALATKVKPPQGRAHTSFVTHKKLCSQWRAHHGSGAPICVHADGGLPPMVDHSTRLQRPSEVYPSRRQHARDTDVQGPSHAAVTPRCRAHPMRNGINPSADVGDATSHSSSSPSVRPSLALCPAPRPLN